MIYFRDKRTNILSILKKYKGERLVNKVPEGKGLIVVYWIGGKRKYPELKGKGQAKGRITFIGEWEYFLPISYETEKKINYKQISENMLSEDMIKLRENFTKKVNDEILAKDFPKTKQELLKLINEIIKEFSLDTFYKMKELLFQPARKPKIKNEMKLSKRHITLAIKRQDEYDKLVYGQEHG